MKASIKCMLALIISLTTGCSGKHLINGSEYLSVIDKSFNERKQLANKRESALFSVFKQELSIKQSEALKFLYAFMPLSDLADYSGDFFWLILICLCVPEQRHPGGKISGKPHLRSIIGATKR
jgi:hypothetical protein